MTVDEAVRSLESWGPGSGEWKPWRAARAEAIALLEQVSAKTIAPFVPRLRAVCTRLEHRDLDAQRAAALPLVRWCVERAEHDELGEVARVMPFSRPVFDAITRAAALGIEVWPLALDLLASRDLGAWKDTAVEQNLVRLLADLLPPDQDAAPERFDLLASREPMLAGKVAHELGFWRKAPLAPLARTLVDLYVGQRGEVRAEALSALGVAARTPLPPGEVARLEAELATASGDELGALASIVSRASLERGDDLEGRLTDPRPRVRLAAIEVLARSRASHPERWARCLRAALDPSDQVRAEVLRLVREGIEEELPFPEAMGRDYIDVLDGPLGLELAELLSFVATRHPSLKPGWLEALGAATPSAPRDALRATLEAPATRACARCRSLPESASWAHDGDAPKGRSELERVASLEASDTSSTSLLRCPACRAHFLLCSDGEHDVNSRRDQYSLERVTLAELRGRYAAHFDASHPRVASWEEGLRADLRHVEPAVREAAARELGRAP